MALKEVSKAVSIHASAWEATLRDGKLVGISEPKSYGCDKNFFIVQGGKGEKTIRR